MNKDIKALTKAIGYCILVIGIFSLIKMNLYLDNNDIDWFVQKVSTIIIWCVIIIMLNNYLLMLVKAGLIKSQFKH